MKIIDYYILTKYLRFVLMGVFGFVFIYITVDLIDHISIFLDRSVPAMTIFRYYYFQIPSLLVLLTPVAVLLSCFFTLGKLSKNFEIIAMQAVGISSYRIMLPVIISAFFIFLMLFYLNEYFVPQYARKFIFTKEVEVYRSQPPWFTQTSDYSFRGMEDDYYFAKIFDPGNNYMESPSIIIIDGAWKVKKKIDSEKALWNGEYWIFQNCYVREFDVSKDLGDPSYERCFFSEETTFYGIATLDEMIVRQIRQDEMSIRELRHYLSRAVSSGARPEIVRKIIVDMHKRASYPAAAFVISLLGAPLALDRRRSSIGVGFGLSLLISFVYWGILQIGISMGYAGTLHPFIASWGANIAFASFGFWMFLKIRR
ncbi:LptF/LptG family permease [candidate division WOR-3 bacterium]|nr:LptF/LptG family permease [candidate division WOR-3 bacterium]